MQIETDTLTGPALNWAVEQMELAPAHQADLADITVIRCNDLYFPKGNENGDYYEPYFKATLGDAYAYGPSSLIASQRCLAVQHFGEYVDVPDEHVPEWMKARPRSQKL